MSNQIPTNFAIKFHDDFIMLSQQRGSRLERSVRTDPDNLNGKLGYFDRIGATDVVEILNRHADTELINTPHSRRRVILRDYAWADMVDKQDLARMMKNPTNKYVMNARWSMGRKKDDLIIAAANGNAFSVDEDDAATTVALPAGQKVLAAAAGLNLAKLLETKEILDGNDVDPDEPRFFIYTSKQGTDLLNTTEIKSADFNTVKALVNGDINTFLGFEFIRTERLTVDGSSDRLCLAYTQSAIGMAIGLEIEVDVGPRRDKNNNIQVHLVWSGDATRVEDEKLVQVACVET